MPRKPKVVSLFTGCGGLDLGLEAAGFSTAVGVEFDRDCVTTVRMNRRWPVIHGDIHDVTSKHILDTAGARVGEIDLLAGGPPCQPFSKSSYWVRGDSLRLDDPRADTLAAYLRVLRDIKPRAFLLENVSGLAYSGKDEGLRLLLDATNEINRQRGTKYRVSWTVLQAADFGVPQLRERVFLVGQREGMKFEFPRPSFSAPEKLNENARLPFDSLSPYRTAWDALADLSDPVDERLEVGGKWGDLLRSIPEGQNYLWHTDRLGGMNLFGWRTRYWSFLLKLAKARPSWAIQAQPGSAIGPFHWANRRLSVREMCRLQTFPDDYKIQGGRSSSQRQLGNAVPSLLAEILGIEIRRQLLGSRLAGRKLKLLPPDRSPAPPPERVRAVCKKYHCHEGAHDPHPGNGKGRRAQQREKQGSVSKQSQADT